MPRRLPAPRRPRPCATVHLRLARLADLAGVATFCEHHQSAAAARGRRAPEMSALLRGHIDTVIVALRERTLVGVALCGVTRGRARLIELAAEPGPEQARIERRLLRRSLHNLRALGLGSLDFSNPGAALKPGPASPLANVSDRVSHES